MRRVLDADHEELQTLWTQRPAQCERFDRGHSRTNDSAQAQRVLDEGQPASEVELLLLAEELGREHARCVSRRSKTSADVAARGEERRTANTRHVVVEVGLE